MLSVHWSVWWFNKIYFVLFNRLYSLQLYNTFYSLNIFLKFQILFFMSVGVLLYILIARRYVHMGYFCTFLFEEFHFFPLLYILCVVMNDSDSSIYSEGEVRKLSLIKYSRNYLGA